jgi:hypothetical protein
MDWIECISIACLGKYLLLKKQVGWMVEERVWRFTRLHIGLLPFLLLLYFVLCMHYLFCDKD